MQSWGEIFISWPVLHTCTSLRMVSFLSRKQKIWLPTESREAEPFVVIHEIPLIAFHASRSFNFSFFRHSNPCFMEDHWCIDWFDWAFSNCFRALDILGVIAVDVGTELCHLYNAPRKSLAIWLVNCHIIYTRAPEQIYLSQALNSTINFILPLLRRKCCCQ